MPTPASEAASLSNLIPKPVAQDQSWQLTTSFLAFLSLFAFALLNSGSVRYKSTQSAVITVILGGVLSILIFWLFGYAFAFGDDHNNHFIGASKFAGSGFDASEYRNDYTTFIFYSVCTLIVTSIFGQGTLERVRFFSFSVCVLFLAGFIFPVLLHWTYGQGWLNKYGYIDFAGSGVIHTFGGMTALLATLIIQHRREKNDPQLITSFSSHSPLYVGYGALSLLFTLIALTGAFDKAGDEGNHFVQAVIIVNVLIAAAFGGLLAFVGYYLKTQETSLIIISRGAIAGVVAVAAGALDYYPWASAVVGGLGGIIYLLVVIATKGSSLDDPAQAISTHFAPGIWGVLAVGLFSRNLGLFYGHGVQQFGFQCIGLFAIIGWALLIIIFLIPLKGSGILKILYSTERIGIDQSYCGGEAVTFADEHIEPQLLNSNPTRKQIFN